jgi:uncharacterized protein (DUF2237 family)
VLGTLPPTGAASTPIDHHVLRRPLHRGQYELPGPARARNEQTEEAVEHLDVERLLRDLAADEHLPRLVLGEAHQGRLAVPEEQLVGLDQARREHGGLGAQQQPTQLEFELERMTGRLDDERPFRCPVAANRDPEGVQIGAHALGGLHSGEHRSDTAPVPDRNVIGGELEPCGRDPLTGFFRDGCCRTGPEDFGSHTICAVVTAEFLEHQRQIGNDLQTPAPVYGFPGLVPGDRWCVTAGNWLRAHLDGAAAFVVLASTHERALEVVPLQAMREHAVDVPEDLSALEG